MAKIKFEKCPVCGGKMKKGKKKCFKCYVTCKVISQGDSASETAKKIAVKHAENHPEMNSF